MLFRRTQRGTGAETSFGVIRRIVRVVIFAFCRWKMSCPSASAALDRTLSVGSGIYTRTC